LVATLLSALFASLLCSLLIYLARGRIFSLVRRSDLRARQATHTKPTLRLGGVGVVFGMLFSAFAMDAGSTLHLSLTLASIPLIAAGFLEDTGVHQSPRARLLLTIISGSLVIWMSGQVITTIGIPVLDPLFALLPISLAFTLFATTGIVHAFNLIDGLNGFAGVNAIVAMGSLLGLSLIVGDSSIVEPALAIMGAVLGFLLLNYPSGRLFLGDGGAYLIGFFIAWLAVHLVASVHGLTPWAVVLVLFWPIADTILAIYRRRVCGSSTVHPDRLHAHHVMMRGIEIALLCRKDRNWSNPMATAALLPFLLLPPLTALAVWDSPGMAAIFTAVFALLFSLFYFGAVSLLRQMRFRRFLFRLSPQKRVQRIAAGRVRLGRRNV